MCVGGVGGGWGGGGGQEFSWASDFIALRYTVFDLISEHTLLM